MISQGFLRFLVRDSKLHILGTVCEQTTDRANLKLSQSLPKTIIYWGKVGFQDPFNNNFLRKFYYAQMNGSTARFPMQHHV